MMEKRLQTLLVKDNAGNPRLLPEVLGKKRPGSFELTRSLRMNHVLVQLANAGVDIILWNMGALDGHGLKSVRRLHAAAPGVPAVEITPDDEALVARRRDEGGPAGRSHQRPDRKVGAFPDSAPCHERHRILTGPEVVRTQQMEVQDELLSHVSPELRSPLRKSSRRPSILAGSRWGA